MTIMPRGRTRAPPLTAPTTIAGRSIDEHEVRCDARGLVKLIRSNGQSGSVILLSEARGPGAVGEELSDIQLLVSEGYSTPTPIGYQWMDVAIDTTKLYDEVISSSKKKIPDEKCSSSRNLAQNEGDD